MADRLKSFVERFKTSEVPASPDAPKAAKVAEQTDIRLDDAGPDEKGRDAQ